MNIESILALGFDFSLAKLNTPMTIIGLVLLLLGLFVVAGARKIDDAIVRKRTGNLKSSESLEADNTADEKRREAEEAGNEIYQSENDVSDDGDIKEVHKSNMMRKSDGSLDYYYIFKVVGLIAVIVGAILTVVGMK